jgi:hypothetical protein
VATTLLGLQVRLSLGGGGGGWIFVVCCGGGDPAAGRSLVQRSRTEYGVSDCVCVCMRDSEREIECEKVKK